MGECVLRQQFPMNRGPVRGDICPIDTHVPLGQVLVAGGLADVRTR
jgi:hypothetical protein